MKTSLKKLTSVFLAVLMVMTVFSVVGVAAADTNKAATGGSSFYFTDNQGWGSVYVYCWDENGTGIGGEWPGVPGNAPQQNGFGETYFTIDVPDGAVGCVVNNGNGAQTTDITDFSAEGYYTDGSKDGNGHFVAIPWPGGDGGEGGGQGGGGGTTGSYYLIGYIDGADYGDGADYANMGDYHFVNGQVTATFTQESYVCVKDTNKVWYMTQGFLGKDVTSATLYNTSITGTESNKLYVPAGTHTFTLSENGDGSLTLSYDGGDEYPTGGVGGENTVYLNPGDFAGDGEWYAYTWSSGAGEWKSGTESNGVYEFNDISDNVIFASASGYPEADWGNCAAQTDDLYATNGATYVISDQRPADGDAGEMRPHYIGEWTDPVPVTDPETEPETQEPTEEVTQPETQGEITTQPETQGEITTQPETQAPTEEQVEPGHGLDITTSLNKVTTGQINAKKDAKVTVTFNMQAPMLLEDGQGTLYYDSSKLTLDEFKLPNVTAGLTTNKKIDNEAKFNFMGVDSETESGLTDFKESKVFVTATFTVKAEGSTTVNLDIEELDGYENGSQVAYYTFGKAAPEAASITESLSKPNVVVVGGETQAPTQGGQPDTQAPTQGGQPDTQAPTQGGQPDTQAPTQGQPDTQAPTQGQPDTQAQPTNPVATKTYKYIPKAEDIASGKNFKITIQDTNGQFHTYDLSPTGEIVDGQQVYAAQIPADVTPAVINYQVFQGPTYVSQVTKSASEVSDGKIVKYDGTIAGQTPVVTQPSSNGGSSTAKVVKKANPIKVKAKKAVKIKASKLKKKAQKVKISKLLKITNAQGTKTFFKVKKGTDKKIYKKLKINKKTGKITLKKGKYKKKTYKIKIKVKVSGKKVGNIQYQAKQVTKVAKIKVK